MKRGSEIGTSLRDGALFIIRDMLLSVGCLTCPGLFGPIEREVLVGRRKERLWTARSFKKPSNHAHSIQNSIMIENSSEVLAFLIDPDLS
jgi:hypothetical protein